MSFDLIERSEKAVGVLPPVVEGIPRPVGETGK